MSETQQHDYSDFKKGPGDNLLKQISATAAEQKAAELRVAELEDQLKEAQVALRDVKEHRLPELMAAAEQKKITTLDGIGVEIKEIIRGSIPAASADQAFAHLEEVGDERLIKREFNIQFGKDEEKWANKFEGDLKRRKKPLRVKRKKAVNPQTLQAYVREKLAKGEKFPMKLFGVYVQKFAKVD